MNTDTKFFSDFHDRCFASRLADLAAVDRDKHIGYLDIGATLKHRHGFTNGGTRCDNIFNDDNAVTVLGLIADDAATLTVVFGFLSIEEERLINAIIARQCTRNRSGKRDALISRAE